MPFQWLPSDESVGAGFVRIAGEQLEKAIAAATASDQPPAPRIHEVRRRVKKLRGLLRLVREGFRPWRDEDIAIRDVSRLLADARDARVVQQALADLLGWADVAAPALPVSEETKAREDEALRSAAVLLHLVRSRLPEWPVQKIDSESLRHGLEKIYRHGREARALALATRDAEDLHDWRKLVKYHATHLDLLAETAEIEARRKDATLLGTLLGTHHDLAMLKDRLDGGAGQLGIGFDTESVSFVLERRRIETENGIATVSERVYSLRPKELVRIVFAAAEPQAAH